MTVELLRFRVEPERADAFVTRNEEIWTRALRDQPGFLRREILIGSERDEIVILVYWRDREALEAFPPEKLARLEARMRDLVVHQEQWVFERVLPAGG
jgi:uncharacterized protein (TIGR03792 family)